MHVFTKQHFEALADLIKNTDAKTKFELAQDLAEMFQKDNEKFKAQKFFKACGLILETETPEMKQAKAIYQKLGCS